MKAPIRRGVVVLGIAGAALPLAGTATASADENTQDPLQAKDTLQETLATAIASFLDAAHGNDRPEGANGLESAFLPFDKNFLGGPLWGLIDNGPLH